MRKVLVLGYFGYNSGQLDGQTVKTRDLYRLAEEQIPEGVDHYDTEDFQYSKLSMFTMLWKVMKCRTVFYLPAHNNLKFIFPVVFVLSLIFRFKIHYFVVGGWLREFLENLPIHRHMLRRIAGIHVETKRLKTELEGIFGFKNVDIFPNFRFFNFEPVRHESDKLRIVFMARINRMKGLDWIFELGDYIMDNHIQNKFSITFYGPVNLKDRQYFESNILRYAFMEYKGELQPSEIHETLSKYDVMLLPTHYYTEGLPGSVIDAYISGVPVIVTEWKHAREFVADGESGYIIPFENGQNQLIEKVFLLARNRKLLHQLQENALKKRMEFAPPSLASMLA